MYNNVNNFLINQNTQWLFVCFTSTHSILFIFMYDVVIVLSFLTKSISGPTDISDQASIQSRDSVRDKEFLNRVFPFTFSLTFIFVISL